MSSIYDIPDHPVIRNLERTGYPDGKEPVYPHCPVCGKECFETYRRDGEVIGCNECMAFTSLDEDDPETCPECGKPCDDAYLDKNKKILGCEHCVSTHDAWQDEDCFPSRDNW